MGDSTLWTKKYLPKTAREVVGQEAAVRVLKEFAEHYKKQKRKACIVYGPSGSGKTAAAYAVAADLGLEVLEVNASDFRNKEQIDSVVGTASKQMSLFSKGKLILVDEVDGLSGMQDRGGIAALTKLIGESAFPVVCTATDVFDRKFSGLRQASMMVDFQPLHLSHVFDILKKICTSEKIACADEDLRTLARRAGGDARAAINDLQMLCGFSRELKKLQLDELSQREQTDTIINALMKVFKTTDPLVAAASFDNVQEDLDEVLLWVDENLPKEYEKPADLSRAYDFVSRADIMRSRIRRWQHWRFLVYVGAYLSAGVAVSKDEKYRKFVQYERTKRLLKIWMANQKYQKRKAIAEKIAGRTRTSARRALQDTLPYIQEIFRKSADAELVEGISSELDLDKEEVEWLKK